MPDRTLRVLVIHSEMAPAALPLADSPFGPFAIHLCADLVQASELLGEQQFAAVLILADAVQAAKLPSWPGLSQATLAAAVVVVAPGCGAELALRLVQAGVQDVLDSSAADEAAAGQCARSLRLAVQRKRLERAARKAYATDLTTGLPNHQQLIEHMSQLLALRGREPAPMALLVLRVEGFDTTEAALGRESANVLRRKVAVRLRGAVRASDVVASLGADTFALLLASTEEPLDADRVAQKLLNALHDPFTLSGQQVGVAVSVGVSLFPSDGSDADVLMRQAVGAAATAQASGRDGFVNWREGVWHHSDGAANDGLIAAP